MRKVLVLAAVWPVLAAAALAQKPPDPVGPPAPLPPDVVVPDAAPVPNPTPPPPPPPGSAIPFASSQWFVIHGSVSYLVVTSPAGVITSMTESGPVKLKGSFVGGNGKPDECQSFPDKYVTTLQVVQSGRVELLVIPSGTTDEKTIIRRTIDATTAPQPPPGPPLPPPPPNDPLAAKLQAAFALDKGTPAQARVLADVYANATINDPVIKTWGDLVARLKVVTSVMLPTPTGLAPPLNAVRTAIAADLKATLGDSPTQAMDDAFRKQVSAEFAKVAAALNTLK